MTDAVISVEQAFAERNRAENNWKLAKKEHEKALARMQACSPDTAKAALDHFNEVKKWYKAAEKARMETRQRLYQSQLFWWSTSNKSIQARAARADRPSADGSRQDRLLP